MSYIKCPDCGNACEVPGVHLCPGEKPTTFILVREGGIEHYLNPVGMKDVALVKCDGQPEAFLDVTWDSGQTMRLSLERAYAERAYALLMSRIG